MTTETEARALIEEIDAKKAMEEAEIRTAVFDALAEEKKVDGLTEEQIAIVGKLIASEKAEEATKIKNIENIVADVAEKKENKPYNDLFGKILIEIHEKEDKEAEEKALANVKGFLAKYKA